jgi:hypothetical protein
MTGSSENDNEPLPSRKGTGNFVSSCATDSFLEKADITIHIQE